MSQPAGETYPLSPGQARVWRLGGAPSSHHVVTRGDVDVLGPVEVDRLRAALVTVVAMHPALRTRLVTLRGLTMPRQWITEAPHIEWHEPGAAAIDGPLEAGTVRAALRCESPERHQLHLAFHVVNGDTRSFPVLVDELARVYAGEPPPAETSASYIAFSEWRNEQLTGSDGERGDDFWRRRRVLPPPALAWPSGGLQAGTPPRSYTARRRIASVPNRSGPELSLESFSRAIVALAAGRLCGIARVVLAELLDGRKYAELEGTIGLLAGAVPLEATLDPRRSLRELAIDLEAAAQEGYEWQETLALDRLLPDQAGFGLGFECATCPERRAGDLSWRITALASHVEPFDVQVSCFAFPDGTFLQATVDPGRCRTEDAERMLDALQALAADALDRPDAPLHELNILPDAERHTVVERFNVSAPPQPVPLLPEVFEECARRWSERIAIDDGERAWTFADLRSRVAFLDRVLRARGAGPERIVAVVLDHTVELVASLLAVLKAGAAYLPIDPELPVERITWLLRDSDVTLAVTDTRRASRLPADVPAILWDELHAGPFDSIPRTDEDAAGVPLEPASLAYVMYTSGSTGQPKGVMVSHEGLANYLDWASTCYETCGSGAPLHSSIGFDLTVTSCFVPLLRGEPVAIVSRAGTSLDSLATLLRERDRFSFIKLTPSHARVLAEQIGCERATHATALLILGGEPLSGSDLRAWRDGAPHVRVVNEYGPTETVVGCVAHHVNEEVDEGSIPIGRPIANTRVYVVDRFGAPVGIGVVGELHVAGPQVARGYLGRPDLTAERFVPDAISGRAGERLYRTGDLARWREDGVLEYRGRVDRQVKVAGYRIEPAEVEQVLRSVGGLREIVVLPRPDRFGELRLVAYVVPEASGSELALVNLDRIRRAAEARLPHWMLPSRYVPVPALPLTRNGKVDLAALPEPQWTGGDVAYAAPNAPDEEILAAIWSQVLEVERVGIDDGYFALGGNSIRSLQIVARAQERGLDLTLDHLFKHRTIRELAGELRHSAARAPDVPPAPFALVAPDDRTLLPDGIVDAYPLARLQAGMAFHRQLAPRSAVYHDVIGYDIEVPWNEALLRAAIRSVVERHPALRTSFDLSRFSEPLQVVHRDTRVPLDVQDLRGLDDAEQKSALHAFMETEKRRDFDLTRSPLLRFIVHRRSDTSFRFWVSFHHAILDGWSDVSMLVELATTYQSLLRGRPISAESLGAEYRDFVALERAAVASPEIERFWREEVRDWPSLRLPRAQMPVTSGTVDICAEPVPVDSDTAEGLKALAHRLAVPLKTVLLAAHLKVMSLLGNGQEAATLMTMNGRPEAPDGDRVLGLHLNSVPLRVRLAGESFADIVNEAFEAEHRVLPFRRFPLVEIQRLAGPDVLPEASFYFTYYYNARTLDELPDLKLLRGEFYEETNFLLVVHFSLRPESGRLKVTLYYDPQRLAVPGIQALAATLGVVLIAIATAAETPHTGVSRLLTPSAARRQLEPAERQRLVVDLNRTTRNWTFTPITAWFSECAAAHASDAAVAGAADMWTYATLAARAEALTRALRAHGVGPGAVVATLFEHSCELVTAVLGILGAGAAYLPLDPQLPTDRLSFLVENAGARLALTQPPLAERAASVAAETWTLDGAARLANAVETVDGRPASVQADDLAYVVYTSGSTGQPKGVMVTHGGLFNYVRWAVDAYGDGERVDALLHSSIGFDLTVTSLFVPLLTGGCIRLAGKAGDLGALIQTLHARPRLGLLKVTPAHARILATTLDAQALADAARVLVVGGEALLGADVAAWTHAGVRVVNEYGPTETVVGCVAHTAEEPGGEGQPVPIGLPIANTQAFVLDPMLEPVPEGVVGELYVGGAGVARGYFGRPDLTAERFVPDAISGRPGERLYKTGDLVRWRGDVLEYGGRTDTQVKLRGYRIELGEIECALRETDGVRDAVVAVRAGRDGEARLIAYVVPEAASEGRNRSLPNELRVTLEKRLPAWMIPSDYLTIDRIPLTHNGKVDREALPQSQDAMRDFGYVAPRNPEEEILAAIWSQVLDVERVSVTDDYFTLGGDSIRSLQIVARARERGLDVTVDHLLRYRTVQDLASDIKVTESGSPDATETVDAPTPEDREALPDDVVDAYPLARMQAGMIFHRELQPDTAIYHNVGGFDVRAPWHEALLREAVCDVSARHPALRTSFDIARYSEPLQLVHRDAPISLVVEDLRSLDESSREGVLRAFLESETQTPFDHRRPPLLRFAVHRTTDETFRFWVSFHHAILDGWSNISMLVELARRYRQLLTGNTYEPPVLVTTFRDFVAAERTTLRSAEARSFWLSQLQGYRPASLTRWPGTSARGVASGSEQRVPIADEIGTELRRLARRLALPFKSLLLAAHLKFISAWSGQDDVMTTLTSNGRLEGRDGARVLGMHLNSTPLRLRLGARTWTGLAHAAFEAERALHPFRRFPFAEVQRLAGDQALAETNFNFTHYHIAGDLRADAAMELERIHGAEQTNFAFGLHFGVRATDGRLLGHIRYGAHFPREQVEEMASYMALVLEAMTRRPESLHTELARPPSVTSEMSEPSSEPPVLTPRPTITSPYVPPSNETEAALCAMWSEVLHLDRVGVESDFFELGGHSLLAMQVIARARVRLRVELPLAVLFEARTVSALAARIAGLRRIGTEPVLRRYDRSQASI